MATICFYEDEEESVPQKVSPAEKSPAENASFDLRWGYTQVDWIGRKSYSSFYRQYKLP